MGVKRTVVTKCTDGIECETIGLARLKLWAVKAAFVICLGNGMGYCILVCPGNFCSLFHSYFAWAKLEAFYLYGICRDRFTATRRVTIRV